VLFPPQALVRAFLSRFQTAIFRAQELVLPVLDAIASPQEFLDPAAMDARNRFARRLLKLLHNALRWRTYARGILLRSSEGAAGGGLPLEQTLAVELVGKVLLPVLEAGWETGCREIAVKVRFLFVLVGGKNAS
jgi:GC-rich sequence DNA-binding factor